MIVRHRVPSVFGIYMVDVLCCALGCVVGTHPGKELPFHLEAGLPVRRRLLGAGKCSGELAHGVPVGHSLKIVSAGR